MARGEIPCPVEKLPRKDSFGLTAKVSCGRVQADCSQACRGPPIGGYLVDPASSHMLVSKIKPCMSKYKLLYTVKLRMAH